MTERQKRFADEYILNGGNAAAAARSAGYAARSAKVTAAKLLSKPEIRAAIDDRLNAAQSERTLEQRDLLEFLSAVVRGEVSDEMLMTKLIGRGQSQIERHAVRASVKDRIRACELLLKIQGAFEKKDAAENNTYDYVAALERIWEKQSAN